MDSPKGFGAKGGRTAAIGNALAEVLAHSANGDALAPGRDETHADDGVFGAHIAAL